MHKTFTDCYFAPGFTGGSWSYALNSNDAGGVTVNASAATDLKTLDEKERRLAIYPLGWESLEVGFEEHKSIRVLIDTDLKG
jgi:hypothetical protein